MYEVKTNEESVKVTPINAKVNLETYTNFRIACIKGNLKIYEGIEEALQLFINKYN